MSAEQTTDGAVAGWKPINTAPKGLTVLVTNGYRVTTAKFSIRHSDWFEGRGDHGLLGMDLTHWMPLPEPPPVQESSTASVPLGLGSLQEP